MADEIYYKIPGSKLTAIADRTRAMAGTTEGMTLDEIIYWLGRVIYIPQGRAISVLNASVLESNGIAILPDVQKTSPISEFTTNVIFETIVTGKLVESTE